MFKFNPANKLYKKKKFVLPPVGGRVITTTLLTWLLPTLAVACWLTLHQPVAMKQYIKFTTFQI